MINNAATVFIFSLEGALASVDIDSWIASHRDISQNMEKTVSGLNRRELPAVDKLIQRIHVSSSLPVSAINSVCKKIPLREKIFHFIERQASHCAIVSEMPLCWLEEFSKKIVCPLHGPVADVQRDRINRLSSIQTKEDVVHHYKKHGEDKVVFIGSGFGDVDAMRAADRAVAFRDTPSNDDLAVSDYILFEEESLCRLLKRLL